MASLIDLLKQAISTRQNFSEMLHTSQENVRVATTANERTEGLRNQPSGTTMVFPNSAGSFNTVGMDYPIDIKKFNKEGNLVRSYQSVPPGIQNLNMGDDPGTVIETASEYQQGGPVKYQQTGVLKRPKAKAKKKDWDSDEELQKLIEQQKRKSEQFQSDKIKEIQDKQNYTVNWRNSHNNKYSKENLDAFIKKHNLVFDKEWNSIYPKGQSVEFKESDYVKWLENPELIWDYFKTSPVPITNKHATANNWITSKNKKTKMPFHKYLTTFQLTWYKGEEDEHTETFEDNYYHTYDISDIAPYFYYAASNKIPVEKLVNFFEPRRKNAWEDTYIDYISADGVEGGIPRYNEAKEHQMQNLGIDYTMGYPSMWFKPKILVHQDVTNPKLRKRKERTKNKKRTRTKTTIKEDPIEEVPVVKEYDFSQNVFPDTFHKGTEKRDPNAAIVLDGYNYSSPQEYVAHMQKVGRPVNVSAIDNRATKEELGLIEKDGQWWAGNEGYNPNYGKKGYMPTPLKWEGNPDENPSKKKTGGTIKYQTEGEVTGTRIPYHSKTREEEIETAQKWHPAGGTAGSFQDWYHQEQNAYYTKYEGVTEADIKKKYKKLKYRSNSQGDETRKEWKQRIKLEEEAELKEFALWPEKVQALKDEEWAKYNKYRHETPGGNIERDKAKAYFTSYFESSKFKERVIAQHGEENYEAIKAEKLEMLNTIDFYETDPEAYSRVMQSIAEDTDYIGRRKDYVMTTGSYRADTHTAQYNVAQAEEMGMSLDSIIVNEITHGTGATDKYEYNQFMGEPRSTWKNYIYDPKTDSYIPDPNAYGVKSYMSDYEREIASNRKESAVNNNHDEHPVEVKSDIESTRYELSKEGMYDFNDPNFQFTEEHLEYMRNNPEKFQKFNKVLSRDYEDEVILEMMNVFVQNDEIMDDTDPNRSMQAQTGGIAPRTGAGTLIQKGLNLFRSEDKKVNPYFKNTEENFTFENNYEYEESEGNWSDYDYKEDSRNVARVSVSGTVPSYERIGTGNEIKNDSLWNYSNIDDLLKLQADGKINTATTINLITKKTEVPFEEYAEEIQIINNYLHSDKFRERLIKYGGYDNPEEVINARIKQLDNLKIYHKNPVDYWSWYVWHRKLDEDDSVSFENIMSIRYGGKNIGDLYKGGSFYDSTFNYIVIDPGEDSSERWNRNTRGITLAHEIGHAIGGSLGNPNRSYLSYNDWSNLALENKNFQDLEFSEYLDEEKSKDWKQLGAHYGGGDKLNYPIPTGDWHNETFDAPYKYALSGWDKPMFYKLDNRGSYHTDLITLYDKDYYNGRATFPKYDELTLLENKWHDAKPGSKLRKEIEQEMLQTFESITETNFKPYPANYPKYEAFQDIANTEKTALGKTWISQLNIRHALNNVIRKDNRKDYEDYEWLNVDSVEEYLNNFTYINRSHKKLVLSAFEAQKASSYLTHSAEEINYMHEKALVKIMNTASSYEYSKMYKKEGGSDLFNINNRAIDDWTSNYSEFSYNMRNIDKELTGDYTEELGLKHIHSGNVHDVGPTESFGDLIGMRMWMARDLGIPIEQDITKEIWEYMLEEYDKRSDRREHEDSGWNFLIMDRMIERYGREWKGWDKGIAGKHNTIADLGDPLEMEKNQGRNDEIAQTGGVIKYQTEGVVEESLPEENVNSLEKPSDTASAQEKRDYWLNLNSHKNFVQRILNPKLNVGREVPHPTKGTLMTHFMTSVEVDGKHLVIPMVVDTGEEKLTFISDEYGNLDTNKAIEYALQTGEFIITDTAEEAEWLANENYKTEDFIRTYGPTGPAKKQMGGWAYMPKYDTSHQKIKSYQLGGDLNHTPYTEDQTVKTGTVRLSGRSIFTDMEDKDLLESLINKVVNDRRGNLSQEEAIERLITLFDFTARRESHYNPVKNKEGTLLYKPTGYSNDSTQKHPALSLYMFKHYPSYQKTIIENGKEKKVWKHSPLTVAIRRVKGYIGNNFMEEAEEIGFIDNNAKPGSKFNPYWFQELQEHMDPRWLTKTQLDILLLLDYAHGNADLTGYLQGDMTAVDFYNKYHHRGDEEVILSKDVKKATKNQTDENWKAFLEEDKEGHFDDYWEFMYD